MSKYKELWEYIKYNDKEELIEYGYEATKISIKNKIIFIKKLSD